MITLCSMETLAVVARWRVRDKIDVAAESLRSVVTNTVRSSAEGWSLMLLRTQCCVQSVFTDTVLRTECSHENNAVER
jgi:hypothetical protein